MLGRDALEEILVRHRSTDGSPDCIVGFSGGRDSSYGLHLIKTKFGMNPIALTYDWGMVTGIAWTPLPMVAAMISVSTALVGPITFLGLLAASLARHLTDSHRHAVLIPAAAMIGALILVTGQFLFERLMGSQSALAVVVEFLGGLLFLGLVLRRGRQ